MNVTSALGWIAFTIVLLIAPLLTRWFCKRVGLEKKNFRGDIIPAASGLTPLFVGLTGYALGGKWPLFWCILAFGVLGFIDDKWGDRSTGGFRGHITALFQQKKITTGMIKLLGGGLTALVCVYSIEGVRIALPMDILLIGLAANTINLLDLRPGRALFAFFLLSTPVAFTYPELILPSLLGALREVQDDCKGGAMLGDTGANLLGAAAGLSLVVALPPWQRGIILLLLLAFNLLAERVSISQKINETPWLRAIDSKLGIR